MTRFLRVPVPTLAAGELRIDGATARYVVRVHRIQPGDKLELFDPASAIRAIAHVESTAKDLVRLSVGPVQSSPRSWLPVTLLQGLGKGTKPEQVVRDATALGVRRLVLVETERVAIKVPESKLAARKQRWLRIAIEAARQSGRGDLPQVVGPVALATALGEEQAETKILMLPGACPLRGQLSSLASDTPIAVLVGPEGGLSIAEVQAAKNAGFSPASLGDNVLRTELAAAAVLGALVAWASPTKSA